MLAEPARAVLGLLLARLDRAPVPTAVALVGPGGSGKTSTIAALTAAWTGAGGGVLDVGDGRHHPAADGRATLVVIDDADRRDEPDVPSVPGPAITLVSLRSPVQSGYVAGLLTRAADADALFRLGPLDEAELVSGLTALLGAAPQQDLLDEVLAASAGSPLIVRRLVAGWVADGSIARGRLAAAPRRDPPALVNSLFGRVGALPATVRQLLGELALAPGSTALEAAGRRDPGGVEALRHAGLVTADGVVPAVAASIDQLLSAAERAGAERQAVLTLGDADAPAATVAERFAAGHAVDDQACLAYLRAGDALTVTDPAAALVWYKRVVAAQPSNETALVGVARAAALQGLPLEVLSATRRIDTAGPHGAPALALSAGAHAAMGMWGQAHLALRAAADAAGTQGATHDADRWRSEAEICGVLAGVEPSETTDAAEHAATPEASTAAAVVAALRLSLTGDRAGISAARRHLVDAVRLAALRGSPADSPFDVLEVGATVAVALGELALAEQLLARCRTTGLRQDAVRAARAWLAVRTGERDAGTGDEPEADGLVALAVRGAQFRRAGDVGGAASVTRRLTAVSSREPIDALNLDAACELLVLARRYGPSVVAADLERHIGDVDGLLAHAPVWQARVAWSRLEIAVFEQRAEALAAAADAVAAAGALSPAHGPLAAAARLWQSIAEGTFDRAEIEQVAADLSDVRLHWEAAQLAGQAAIRTERADDAKSLLGRARMLRAASAGGPSTARAGADRPVTPAGLSEREVEVARLVLDGLTHKEIGASLYISPKTVEHHVAHIRQKLGTATRAETLNALRADLRAIDDPG